MKLLAQNLTLPGTTEGSSVVLDGPLDMGVKGMITLGSIVSKASTFIFAFAGLGLLLMLVMAGFTFLTSAGDAKKLEGAKGQLTNAIIGFLLIFTAFWIVQVAGKILGFETITSTFK